VTVALLALAFTMVNVQLFAASGHRVDSFEWWISWLLDPMASITMGTAIVFEGVLAGYDRKEGWLAATKWYAGGCTWAMNIWSSLVAASPSGVLLHSVAPGLVLLLAEAAPRVRRMLTEIVAGLERQAVDAEQARRDAQLAVDRAEHEARQRELEARREQPKPEPVVAAPIVVAPPVAPLPRPQRTQVARPARDVPASRQERRDWAAKQLAANPGLTGSDVDRRFGPPRNGAAVVKEAKQKLAEQQRSSLHIVGGK
jgi:hypothetical protein